jgi:predicted RNA-binding protein YlxR (DUF448 family)
LRQEFVETEKRAEAGENARRCALSRKSLPKEELIRFVRGPEGDVVPDLKGRLPGRGVWIEATKPAVADAVRRNAFARSLKAEVKVSADLADRVGRFLDEAALAALALANKAGEAVFGTAKVEEAIARGRVLALVHARDSAPDGCRKLDAKFRAKMGPKVPSPVTLFASSELDLASGRSNVIHAAVIQGGAAAKFLAAASRVERYRGGSGAFANRTGSDTDKE